MFLFGSIIAKFALICVVVQFASGRLRRLYGKNPSWYYRDGNPGLKMRITKSGLNKIKNVGVDILNRELPRLTIPKYSKPAGAFTINLNNIKISRYTPPRSTSLVLRPPTSMEFAMRDVQLSLASGFLGTYGAIKASGSMTGSATGVNVIMRIRMLNTDRGGLVAKIEHCAGSLTDATFNVEVGGLIGAFIRQNQAKLSSGLKDALPAVLCDIMNALLLTSINRFLEEINFQVPVRLLDDRDYRYSPLPAHIDFVSNIQRNLTMDNHVLRPVIVAPNFIEVHHKGEMMYRDDIIRTPFKPKPYRDELPGNKMLYITAEDYVLNSLLYHAYVRDRLTLTLRSSDRDSGGFLHTTCKGNSPKTRDNFINENNLRRSLRETPRSQCIGDLIPPLGRDYPDRETEIMIIPHGVPDFHFTEGEGILQGQGRSLIMVEKQRGRKIPVLTTNLKALSHLKLGLKNGRIVGKMETEKLQLRMHSTSLKDLSTRDVVKLGPLSKRALDPQLSRGLLNGVLIPKFDILEIVNPKLTIHEGYSSFSADFHVNKRRASLIIGKAMQEGAQKFG